MSNKTLKLIRLYLDLTQKQFATRFGIAESTVSKIEAGFTTVTDVTRAKVIRQFDLANTDFIAFSEQMENS